MSDSAEEVSAAEVERQMSASVIDASGWHEGTVDIHNGATVGSGFDSFNVVTPLTALIAGEEVEGDEAGIRRQVRVETLTALISALIGDGSKLDPVAVGATVFAWAWDLQIHPFNNMTQEQLGEILAQTRAAFSARHKKQVQKKKEQVGQVGSKSSRQRSPDVVEIYRQSAKGNTSRRTAANEKKLNNFKRRERRK